MPWFVNWGQVLQLILAGVALCFVARPAFLSMTMNDFLSTGAIVFYLLVMMVVVALGRLIVAVRNQRVRRSESPSSILNQGGTQEARPTIGLILQESTMRWDPRGDYRLKLYTTWVNEGNLIHIGRPRWIAEMIGIQGSIPIAYFRRETDEQEAVTIDVAPGQHFEMWIALDPAVSLIKATEMKNEKVLGMVVLPVKCAGKELELVVRP